jgi:hypothetical protein
VLVACGCVRCAAQAGAGTSAKQRLYNFTESGLQAHLAELQRKRDMDEAVHQQMVAFLKRQHEVREHRSCRANLQSVCRCRSLCCAVVSLNVIRRT